VTAAAHRRRGDPADRGERRGHDLGAGQVGARARHMHVASVTI
jgi:hypothetical protein